MKLCLAIVAVVLVLSATCGALSYETDEDFTANELQQQEQLQESVTKIASSRAIPNYKLMNFNAPKRVIQFASAHGICFGPDGKFVIVSWSARLITLFSNCGDVIRKIPAPGGSRNFGDCAFTSDAIFVTDYGAHKIYQFSVQGSFRRVFATGHHFLRLAAKKGYLYATKNTNLIFVFRISNRRLIRTFHTSPKHARGIAFDSANNMHITILGNSEEVYTVNGKQVKKNRYCGELNAADGIAIDAADNVIIAAHQRRGEVLVYNSKGFLIKRLKGFPGYATDVAVDKLGNLWVAVYNKNMVYKF